MWAVNWIMEKFVRFYWVEKLISCHKELTWEMSLCKKQTDDSTL